MKADNMSRPTEQTSRPAATVFQSAKKRSGGAAETVTRALLVFCAVFGLCHLIFDSLSAPTLLVGMAIPTILLWTLISFLLFASKKTAPIGALLAVAVCFLFARLMRETDRDFFRLLAGGAVYLWNQFMIIVDAIGYMTFPLIGETLHETPEAACFLLSMLLCPLFRFAVGKKKTHLFFALLLITGVCAPFLIYNLPNTNIGLCFLLAAIAGLSAMRISEKYTGARSSAAFSGLAALLLSAVLLPIPAMLIREPWRRIDSISSSIDRLVTLVVDLVNGNSATDPDPSLADPIGDRDTTADDRVFRGWEILYAYSDTTAPLYLRNWVGADFDGKAWSAPDTDFVDIESQLGYPSEPYYVTYDMIDAYLTMRLKTGSPETPMISYMQDLNLVTAPVLIYPRSQSRLIAVPYMTAAPLTAPSGSDFSHPYRIVHDGIYLADKNITTTDSYRVMTLIPLSRDHEEISAFLERYLDPSQNSLMNSEARRRNRLYTAQAGLLYDGSGDSDETAGIIRLIVEDDLFRTTDIARFFRSAEFSDKSELPDNAVAVFKNELGQLVCYYPDDRLTLLDKDFIVQTVVSYLASRCRYTLTPQEPTSGNSMEEFLLISKEGYCVQFATAATLILRQLGFHARYAEGYIASSFGPNPTPNGYLYRSTVLDRDAHAWVEVWIDGFGWMQYEVTPGFTDIYSGEYPYGSTPVDTTTPPPDETTTPEESTDTEPPVTTERPPESTVTTPPDTDEPPLTTEMPPSPHDSGGGILLAVFLPLSAGAIALTLFGKRSASRQKRRQALLKAALSGDPARAAAVGAPLTQALFDTLRAFGLIPGDSELPSAFAARADAMLSGIPIGAAPSKAILAIGKQRYGSGMSQDDCRLVATLIRDLTAAAPMRLGKPKFLWNRHVLCLL